MQQLTERRLTIGSWCKAGLRGCGQLSTWLYNHSVAVEMCACIIAVLQMMWGAGYMYVELVCCGAQRGMVLRYSCFQTAFVGAMPGWQHVAQP
jgi:hypothetical protein